MLQMLSSHCTLLWWEVSELPSCVPVTRALTPRRRPPPHHLIASQGLRLLTALPRGLGTQHRDFEGQKLSDCRPAMVLATLR